LSRAAIKRVVSSSADETVITAAAVECARPPLRSIGPRTAIDPIVTRARFEVLRPRSATGNVIEGGAVKIIVTLAGARDYFGKVIEDEVIYEVTTHRVHGFPLAEDSASKLLEQPEALIGAGYVQTGVVVEIREAEAGQSRQFALMRKVPAGLHQRLGEAPAWPYDVEVSGERIGGDDIHSRVSVDVSGVDTCGAHERAATGPPIKLVQHAVSAATQSDHPVAGGDNELLSSVTREVARGHRHPAANPETQIQE
jgi:hypothetical protein